jgi:hypothetical protein
MKQKSEAFLHIIYFLVENILSHWNQKPSSYNKEHTGYKKYRVYLKIKEKTDRTAFCSKKEGAK